MGIPKAIVLKLAIFFVLLDPGTIGQWIERPVAPRPLCSSQITLATHACSLVPYVPGSPPSPPPPPLQIPVPVPPGHPDSISEAIQPDGKRGTPSPILPDATRTRGRHTQPDPAPNHGQGHAHARGYAQGHGHRLAHGQGNLGQGNGGGHAQGHGQGNGGLRNGHGPRSRRGHGHRRGHGQSPRHRHPLLQLITPPPPRHRHHHRHRHRVPTPVEVECCRWLRAIDRECVCDLLVFLPPFLSRPVHHYRVSVQDACNITWACGSRILN